MSIFLNCLKEYCSPDNEIKEYKNNFFNLWFLKGGKHYTFVFKQNLRVTNIQYKELIVLLQKFSNYHEKNELIFLSTEEFVDKINNLISCFISDDELLVNNNNQGINDELTKKLVHIDNIYREMFEKIIVVDPYYGSCAVFIPHNIEIDLSKICFYSGYIHSCGENVFTRNMKKANKIEFMHRLKMFLDKNKKNDSHEKIKLMLYTHEDFSYYDRIGASNDFLKNGLDNIKFFVEKCYMQKTSLYDVLESIKKDENLGNFYDIMPSGNYHEKVKKAQKSCLWLIVDHDIGDKLQFPGGNKYYICYHQEYINENPFHLFDENKPGWIDHVTIPHTLTGAMLNIGLSDFMPNDKVKAIDPFVGSGTTYLESMKHENIIFTASDLCSLTNIITKDNFKFFSMNINELDDLNHLLFYIINKLEFEIKKGNSVIQDYINENYKRIADTLYSKYETMHDYISDKNFSCKNENEFIDWTDVFIKTIFKFLGIKEKNDFEKYSFITRLLTYTMIKAEKRSYYAKLRERKIWIESFYAELYDLYLRLKTLLKQRKRIGNINESEIDPIIIYNGSYSLACSLSAKYLSKKQDSIIISKNKNIKKKLDDIIYKKEKYQIIIMDPPYGFNTEEDVQSFSILYKDIFELILKIIDDNGVMLLCLPAQSHSGKEVNYFTQKEIVLQQIYTEAIKNKMSIQLNWGNSTPAKEIFMSPFYWDSEKALKRDIVCIKFLKNK